MIFQMKTANGDRYTGAPFWVLNEWVHLALTIDNKATLRAYRSGVLVDSIFGSDFAEKVTRSKHWFESPYNDNKFKVRSMRYGYMTGHYRTGSHATRSGRKHNSI